MRDLLDSPRSEWAAEREFGIHPSSESMHRMVELIGGNCRWDHDGQPYWDGEVEPCINGRTMANGSYFGVEMGPLVERLVGERLEDGGWNAVTSWFARDLRRE